MEIIDLEQQIIVKNKPDSLYSFPDNWQLRSFGEIVISSQYGISSSSGGFYSVPILKMNNLQDGHIDLRGLDYIQLSKVEMESLLLRRGDLLINRTNSPDLVGKTAVYDLDGEYVFASYLVRFRLVPSVASVFVSYFLNSELGKNKLKLLATKAVSQANINPSTLKRRLLVPIPPLPEQHAIATALGDIDALITSLDKLIAKKRDIQQATMQQLLTGKTRLPGFSKETNSSYKQTEVGTIPEDWVVKMVSEIANVKGGKRLPAGKTLSDSPTSYPYIRITDMFPGGVSLNEIKYVPNDVFPLIKNYRIFNNDIFVTVAGTLGIIGKIPSELNGANLTENADKITNITCDKDYLFYTLLSPRIQKTIEADKTVGAQPKLALNRIENFRIALPIHKPEQTAIATVLSDMDAEIAALEQKREKTRMLKQGMMQELLTGKTRLL